MEMTPPLCSRRRPNQRITEGWHGLIYFRWQSDHSYHMRQCDTLFYTRNHEYRLLLSLNLSIAKNNNLFWTQPSKFTRRDFIFPKRVHWIVIIYPRLVVCRQHHSQGKILGPASFFPVDRHQVSSPVRLILQ